jgi:hypothetical protein
MTFFHVKDGRITASSQPTAWPSKRPTKASGNVYYETTEQHETTEEQLRLHATMCFDGDCPECAR